MSAAARQPVLREVRLMLPDPEASGFREEVARQAALLARAEEEGDILAFMDAVWADIDADATAGEVAAGVPHPWSVET